MEILIVLAIIVSLSILVIVHEFGHFLAAKKIGVLVEEFGFGFPPRMWAKKIGETIYSLNWIPFGGFVKIFGMDRRENSSEVGLESRKFNSRGVFKRAVVIVAGIVMNFIAGWFLLAIVFMIGSPQALVISDVKPASLAEKAGIVKNDMLISFKTVDEFTSFISANKGKEVIVNVKRGSQNLEIKIMPRVSVPEGEGNLGVYLSEAGAPKMGFFESIWESLLFAGKMFWMIINGFIDLFAKVFSGKSVMENLVGPVGLVNIVNGAAAYGFANLLYLLALISLNLAVFNLLPLPVLDGGWLLLLLIEKIRGKAATVRTEMIFNGIGFVLLTALAIMVTVKDVWSLF